MALSNFFNGQLYGRMSDDLQLAGVSKRMHDGYLRAVRQLADYCSTPPDQITEDQLRRFFPHLKNERHFASGSMRVAFQQSLQTIDLFLQLGDQLRLFPDNRSSRIVF